MKVDSVIEILEGLDWKVIKSLHIAGFYADVPGGTIELIDGSVRAFNKTGSPMWTTKNAGTEDLHERLAVSTGRKAELDKELVRFLTGRDTLWESE